MISIYLLLDCFALYEIFFLQNNVTIVTTQDSRLIIRRLRVTLGAFSNVT